MVEFFERRKEKKKITAGRWVLIVLGIILAFMLMLGIVFWIWFSVTFKEYRNDKDGLRIFYPKTWQVNRDPVPEVKVIFISPKEHALDNFQESINFSTFDMSKEMFSTEAYASLIAEQMLMVFPDLTLAQQTFFPVGGQEGYRLVLASSAAGKVFVIYAFTMEEMGYNLLFMGDTEVYIKYRLMLDVMALTMKVKYQ